MKIKQFLKPDWRKILIIVILFVISTIPYIGYNYSGSNSTPSVLNTIDYGSEPCPPSCTNNYEINRILWLLPSYNYVNFSTSPNSFIFLHYEFLKYGWSGLLLISINLFYWYLLSCLIIWIYDKVKRK